MKSGDLDLSALSAHLTERYGIESTGTKVLDQGVVRIDRASGAPWVARVFPRSRPLEAVNHDAAMLRWLADESFPAERLAVEEAVTTTDRNTVIVTEFLSGAHPKRTPDRLRDAAILLGRLSSMRPASEIERPAGALHHWSPAGGRAMDDVAVARQWLTAVAKSPAGRGCEPVATLLMDELQRIGPDDDRLSQSAIHPDFHMGNLVELADETLVPIDWTGGGIGATVISLGMFVTTSARSAADVAAIREGFYEAASLETDDLSYLRDALARPCIVLKAFQLMSAVLAGQQISDNHWNATASGDLDRFAEMVHGEFERA